MAGTKPSAAIVGAGIGGLAALPPGEGSGRYRGGILDLRGDPQGAHLKDPVPLSPEQVDEASTEVQNSGLHFHRPNRASG